MKPWMLLFFGLVLGACSSNLDALTDANADTNGGADTETNATSSSTTTSTLATLPSGDEIGVFEVELGDCLLLPSGSSEGEVETLDTISCAQPHDGEVLALTEIALGFGEPYPGDEFIEQQAQVDCVQAFNDVTGVDFFQDLDWDLTWLTPTVGSWEQLNDREIVCIVTPLDGEPTTGRITEGPINTVPPSDAQGDGEVGVFEVEIGECLLFPSEDLEGTVETLTTIQCTDPHDGEVIALPQIPGELGSPYPGDNFITERAEVTCVEAFNTITGVDFYQDPTWDLTWLTPTNDSWTVVGDREVVCIAIPLNGEQTTETLL